MAVEVPPAYSFTVVAEDVPATNTRIQIHDEGELVGTVVLIHPLAGQHLIVGEQEWRKPEAMPVGAPSQLHFAAVAGRLLDEAVAMADRLGMSLSSVTPGSLFAERFRAHGFRRSGDSWFRDRPGSVVPGTLAAGPA